MPHLGCLLFAHRVVNEHQTGVQHTRTVMLG